MQILYEILIFIGVGIFMSWFTTLFLNYLLPGNTVVYIANDEIKKKFYHLSKSKIFFLPAFAYPILWKKGWILKRTFWGIIITYIYYFLGLIADIVYYFATNSFFMVSEPIAFVFVLIGSLPILILCCFVLGVVQTVQEKHNREP